MSNQTLRELGGYWMLCAVVRVREGKRNLRAPHRRKASTWNSKCRRQRLQGVFPTKMLGQIIFIKSWICDHHFTLQQRNPDFFPINPKIYQEWKSRQASASDRWASTNCSPSDQPVTTPDQYHNCNQYYVHSNHQNPRSEQKKYK